MQTILTVNGGSSSLKCALFELRNGALTLLYGFKLGNILNTPRFKVKDASGATLEQSTPDYQSVPKEERHQACLQTILNWLSQHLPESSLVAIGHRVVHGGEIFSEPCIVTSEVKAQLEKFIPLAPLHQPYNLRLIEACQALEPTLPQIACFDTMFHSKQSNLEKNYALPRQYTDEGVRRYGFHGLSYEFIQRQLTQLQSPSLNTVVCHLGAGASMCAIKNGVSIASSMGFTAVDGLPMGSRCGNIDPGVLLYLQRQHQMDADQLETLIYKQSGWLGVSGISSDMLELHRAEQPEAEEAIEMFCYRAALEIGRLSAALEGLGQIVFTGGVGENDADVRQRILNRCRWLGITYSEDANQNNENIISLNDSAVTVRVIATNEETMIATHVLEITKAHS
ncbi:acetate/propionate family kinase [Neptuniibacter sp. 1_MG-2023]|uniref:acetate/propionate family kinase n=1 Tax=Neptuniibacter sp. 1_MG-2023 TaxID=3062662 RepID=UPI0026E39751|nr:acetate/propionate family kinase [Neptuniibacter sp. 1_MG-2023]MDO6593441.1 acetate/propionate family kinase [Neptuniibacter sp. 1_MG-2023]